MPNPVLQAMLADGIARPDPLKLGLDITEHYAVVGQDGTASRRLYALGPVTAGVLSEVIAVPDIRLQAARLAASLSTSRTASGSHESAPANTEVSLVGSSTL